MSQVSSIDQEFAKTWHVSGTLTSMARIAWFVAWISLFLREQILLFWFSETGKYRLLSGLVLTRTWGHSHDTLGEDRTLEIASWAIRGQERFFYDLFVWIFFLSFVSCRSIVSNILMTLLYKTRMAVTFFCFCSFCAASKYSCRSAMKMFKINSC